MLPLIEREVVDKNHWIDGKEFVDMIALAQAAPGLIAVNSAIFIGQRIAGWKGVVACVSGAVLPSIVIILLIAIFFKDIKDNPTVESVFKGVRPAVVALIAATVIRLIKRI